MIYLTRQPIDLAQVLESVRAPAAGAVVLFVGTAREMTAGCRSTALDYEAYEEMAQQELIRLASDAQQRWPIVHATVAHRLGRVELAEVCVAIAVSAPHRQEAFQAAAWLIDQIKQVVPIWKCEHWADGTAEWVHPGPSDAPVRSSPGRS